MNISKKRTIYIAWIIWVSFIVYILIKLVFFLKYYFSFINAREDCQKQEQTTIEWTFEISGSSPESDWWNSRIKITDSYERIDFASSQNLERIRGGIYSWKINIWYIYDTVCSSKPICSWDDLNKFECLEYITILNGTFEESTYYPWYDPSENRTNRKKPQE